MAKEHHITIPSLYHCRSLDGCASKAALCHITVFTLAMTTSFNKPVGQSCIRMGGGGGSQQKGSS